MVPCPRTMLRTLPEDWPNTKAEDRPHGYGTKQRLKPARSRRGSEHARKPNLPLIQTTSINSVTNTTAMHTSMTVAATGEARRRRTHP